MKSYIIPLICISSFLNSMEQEQQQITRAPQEWNAQDYAQGNKTQELAGLVFLQKSGINLKNKKVLDIGCGTGNITAKVAENAKKVQGIDASKNMIDYAQKTYAHIPNLSFKHSFIENFTTEKRYNTAITLFCLHWIKDKQQALEKINAALKMNSDFFGTLQSSSDPEPFHFTVLKEIIPGIPTIYSFLKQMNWIQAMDYFIISDEELKELLSKNGFDIISYEHKSFDITINKTELENGARPVLMSRPFMKAIPEVLREWFFNYYINETLKKMILKEDGDYIIPSTIWSTTVFHARKIMDIK